jgi:hypothetical protein
MRSLKWLALVGIFSLLVVASASAAEKSAALQLIELAKSDSPQLREAIAATFDAKNLKDGTAWIAHGPDFLFAAQASSQPSLVIIVLRVGRLIVLIKDSQAALRQN